MALIQEANKVYEIDDKTGKVLHAYEVADTEMVEALLADDPIFTGDQVTVDGREGQVVLITSSVYGPAYAVKFFDGSVDEYPESSLKRSTAPEPVYDSLVAQVRGTYEEYQKLPYFTREEMGVKAAEARKLNLTAKTLISDKSVTYAEQALLDHVVVSTSTDILDLQDGLMGLDVADQSDRYSKFNLEADVFPSGPPMGLSGDASWLETALDDGVFSEVTESDMAVRAAEVMSNFDRDQLSDPEFVKEIVSYQVGYLGLNEEQEKKFTSYVETLCKETTSKPEVKTAAVEEDTTDFDTSALYS